MNRILAVFDVAKLTLGCWRTSRKLRVPFNDVLELQLRALNIYLNELTTSRKARAGSKP